MWQGRPITETFVVMGPRLRGDDSGWVRAHSLACLAVDFFTGSKAGIQGPITLAKELGPRVRGDERT